MNNKRCGCVISILLFVLSPVIAIAVEDVGQIKVSVRTVYIERGGQRLPAPVGTKVQATDTIVTGADGSVGITFNDDSRMSAGPNSTLAINRFNFNQATHAGNMDAALKRGTLSVVSGKLTKQSPAAMVVRTPNTVLGIRGTEFVARAGESAAAAKPAPKPAPEAAPKPAPESFSAELTISCDHRLLACKPPASADYIVLLPGPDGKTGAVAVRLGGSEVVLDSAYASAATSSDGGLRTGRSSAAEVNQEFAVALETAPLAPASFIVHFTARVEFAGEFEPELKRVLEELARRASPEVTVIGHTDRVGTDKANLALGLQRAERVRKILLQRGVPAERVVAASRGEREPLVPTADEVPEPRNRRVDMSVR